ncbi:hypothetical protein IPC1490_18650 [Pseudomonas aeruginosa]|nr:hypothetical protein IPC1490_18650 [Pseudomonas aeruginosa]
MPKPLVGIVAGITPNIDALELNQDISLAAVAASTWAGVPDFGICNMAFLAPGDPLVIGSDTWRVYPLLQRGSATDFGNTSAWVGYCFRVLE